MHAGRVALLSAGARVALVTLAARTCGVNDGVAFGTRDQQGRCTWLGGGVGVGVGARPGAGLVLGLVSGLNSG
jgi:hypothetical protein